jgi:hypothetical protein
MKNYVEYLNRKNSQIPKINKEILEKGKDIPQKEVLRIEDINQLLKDGYLNYENGFFHFEDKSAYAAVLTKMPKVSIEMIDWWFWWHAKEPLRYKIWYPEMHFDISSDFGEYYHDEPKTYRERLHLSKHFVTEDIGTGKEKIVINFMPPKKFGFNKNKLKNENEETIICAKVGDLKKRVWHTKMCHAVRKVEEGVEMRSRFWMANKVERMDKFGKEILNSILNKSFIKKKLLPNKLGKYMFHHCSQEYNNLKDILPEIYQNEKL